MMKIHVHLPEDVYQEFHNVDRWEFEVVAGTPVLEVYASPEGGSAIQRVASFMAGSFEYVHKVGAETGEDGESAE